MKKQFKLENGRVELNKPFPKAISQKRALDLIIEKGELVLSEMEAGTLVYRHGGWNTCAGCYRAAIKEAPDGCGDCLIFLHEPSKDGCINIDRSLDNNRRLNGAFRLPEVRKALNQLYIIRAKSK